MRQGLLNVEPVKYNQIGFALIEQVASTLHVVERHHVCLRPSKAQAAGMLIVGLRGRNGDTTAPRLEGTDQPVGAHSGC